jgi:hypothetical protein
LCRCKSGMEGLLYWRGGGGIRQDDLQTAGSWHHQSSDVKQANKKTCEALLLLTVVFIVCILFSFTCFINPLMWSKQTIVQFLVHVVLYWCQILVWEDILFLLIGVIYAKDQSCGHAMIVKIFFFHYRLSYSTYLYLTTYRYCTCALAPDTQF